jgi:hypothetical protein
MTTTTGELKYGTDESTFTRVLVRNSYAQLDAVSKAYQELSGGKTLAEAVEGELSGHMLSAAKAIRESLILYCMHKKSLSLIVLLLFISNKRAGFVSFCVSLAS